MNRTFTLALIEFFFLFGCKQAVKSDSSHSGDTVRSEKTTEAHFDTKIAEKVNNQITLAPNINDIVSNWETIVNQDSNLLVNYESINVEIDNGKYFLVGVDKAHSEVSAVRLVLSNNVFYEKSYSDMSPSSSSGGQSCTCKGCTSTGTDRTGECSPKENENGWYCTGCSQGTCTKTVTFQNGGILNL